MQGSSPRAVSALSPYSLSRTELLALHTTFSTSPVTTKPTTNSRIPPTHAQHTQWLTQEHPQQVEHAVDSVRAAATVVDVVVAVDEVRTIIRGMKFWWAVG